MCSFVRYQYGHSAQQFFQIEIRRIHLQHTGLDFGKIQHVVDDAQKVLAGLLDLLQVVALQWLEVCLEGQIAHPDDGIHGGADLVAHVGQKVAFVLHGNLELGVFKFHLSIQKRILLTRLIQAIHGYLQLGIAPFGLL